MPHLVLSVTLALLSAVATVPLAAQDRALFIAVDDYAEWPPLNNPVKDATALAAVLADVYGYRTEVLPNPTRVDIFRKLDEYRNLSYGPQDQLFVFFSGHGEFTESTAEGFFIPREGRLDDPYGLSYLQHARLERAIDNIPCRHVLLALDACYSGTFDRAIAQLKHRGKRPARTAQESREVFLRRGLRARSRLYLTSGGKERTPDGEDHSPFTRALLSGLGSYGGPDELLSFFELLSFMERADPLPRAGRFGSHEVDGGYFFVVRNAAYRAAPAPPRPTTDAKPAPQDWPNLSAPQRSAVRAGIEAIQASDVAEAKRIFRRLREERADDPVVYEALYKLYVISDSTQAENFLREGLDRYPRDNGLVFSEINHYLGQNRHEEMISRLKLAIRLEPDNLSLYKTLGRVYEQLYTNSRNAGEQRAAARYFFLAEEYYDVGLARAPEDVDLLYSYGTLHFNDAALGTSELAELADDLSREGQARYDAKKAEVTAAFGRALPYFKRAEARNPNDLNTLVALREIYAFREDLSTAQEFKRRLDRVRAGQTNDTPYFGN